MIQLKQGAITVSVYEDNPIYDILYRFVGEPFVVVQEGDYVQTPTPPTRKAKNNKFVSEPSAEELMSSLSQRASNGKQSPTIKPTFVEEQDDYFEVTVNTKKVFEDLDKLYLADNTIKSLLKAHIEKVLGTSENSAITTSHYKASEKYSKSPFITLYRYSNELGPMYLTVHEEKHDAKRE